MDTEEAVQRSVGLLQRMSDNPNEVVDVLDTAEREKVVKELGVLAERSAGVEDEADLLSVTDTLHRLLGETPALARLLLAQNDEVTSPQKRPTTRRISFDYDREAYRKSTYAQRHAAQIHNYVVRCREALEQALLEPRRGTGYAR